MKKRSSYRPRPVNTNALYWVLSGVKPVAKMDEMQTVRIKNHMALAAVIAGVATSDDLKVLTSAINMSEALKSLGFGQDWTEELHAAHHAVLQLCERAIHVFTEEEIATVQLAMDVHDAQLDHCTVRDVEKALEIIQDAIKHKRATVIRSAT